MSTVNLIQSKILELEGGAFQKLFDEYLYKKYGFKNIQVEKKDSAKWFHLRNS